MHLTRRERGIFGWFLGITAILLTLVLCCRSEAWEPVELKSLDLVYRNASVFGNAYNPLIFPNTTKEVISLETKADVLEFGFLGISVVGLTDAVQFAGVGLDLDMGVRLSPLLDVGFHHSSYHVLDYRQPFNHFPLEDSLVIRIHFIQPAVDKSLLVLP